MLNCLLACHRMLPLCYVSVNVPACLPPNSELCRDRALLVSDPQCLVKCLPMKVCLEGLLGGVDWGGGAGRTEDCVACFQKSPAPPQLDGET